MQDTKPLFRFDAGWLYVVAGLAICAGAILVPVRQDLRELQGQLEDIRTKEYLLTQQLQTSSFLLDQIDARDEALIRRLAASQLNLVPAERRPLLRSINHSQSVIDWMNATIRYETISRAEPPASLLDRLTTGGGRLWMFGLGVLCVFMGLLLDPTLGRLQALRLSRWGSRTRDSVSVALEMTRAAGPYASRRKSSPVVEDEQEYETAQEAAVAREARASMGGLRENDLDLVRPEALRRIDAYEAGASFDPLVPSQLDQGGTPAVEPIEGDAGAVESHAMPDAITDRDPTGDDADGNADDGETTSEAVDQVELDSGEQESITGSEQDPDPESDLDLHDAEEVIEEAADKADEELVDEEVDEVTVDIDEEEEHECEIAAEEDDEEGELPTDEDSEIVDADAEDAEEEDEAGAEDEEEEWEYVDEDEDAGEDDEDGEYEYTYVYVDEDGNEIEEDEVEEVE